MTTRAAITSVELNYLVFRYLQESGFTHSAFSLGYEAGINKCDIDGNLVPPGALITVVQKGLQYIELEANLDENDQDVNEDFSLLQPLDLITKGVDELQDIIRKRKREKPQNDRDKDKKPQNDRDKEKGKEKESVEEHERQHGGERERERHDKEKEQDREKEKTERDREQEKEKERDKQHVERIDKVKHDEDSLGGGGPTPMDITPTAHEISSSDVTILEGHSSEVFACAWSPAGSLLASGSGDSTARIWTIPEGPCGSSMQSSPPSVHVLKHFKGRTNEKSKDVTTLDWNGEGTLLATGSYDGQARIWSRDGKAMTTSFRFGYCSLGQPSLDDSFDGTNRKFV